MRKEIQKLPIIVTFSVPLLISACAGPQYKSSEEAFRSKDVQAALQAFQFDGLFLIRQDEILKRSTYYMEFSPTMNVQVPVSPNPRDNVRNFDLANPQLTSNLMTSTYIYDGEGKAHEVRIYLNRAKESSWSWHAVLQSESPILLKRGYLTFDGLNLKAETSSNLLAEISNLDQRNFFSRLNFRFGADSKLKFRAPVAIQNPTTASSVIFTLQDGYPAGTIVGLSSAGVPKNKRLAIYSNGQNRVIPFYLN